MKYIQKGHMLFNKQTFDFLYNEQLEYISNLSLPDDYEQRWLDSLDEAVLDLGKRTVVVEREDMMRLFDDHKPLWRVLRYLESISIQAPHLFPIYAELRMHEKALVEGESKDEEYNH